MAEILTPYISLGIATISILIVLWDHYKDDRILTKQVQNFYKNIEGLIFSNYKMKLNLEKFDENKESYYEKEFFKYEKQNIYYRGIVNQAFDDMARYLGLTYFSKPRFYYSNDNEYFIEHTGAFYTIICNLPQVQIGFAVSFHDEQLRKIIIDKESIKIMEHVLETLRNHWNKVYFKRILRKKLRQKLDFSELLLFN